MLFFQEAPVTAAKFLRNAGNRRYFTTNFQRFCNFSSADRYYRRKFLGKILTRLGLEDRKNFIICGISVELCALCYIFDGI